MQLRAGTSDDHKSIAKMFRQIWLDNNISPNDIAPDWESRVLSFLEKQTKALSLQSFMATENDKLVGCSACQIFDGLYPNILKQSVRRYGYIWCVFVDAEARGALTQSCIDALRALGCTHAILHAAPMGKGIYERMGFEANNEMRFALQ